MSAEGLDDADCGQVGRFIKPSPPLFRGENMMETTCDKKGRIHLREAIRARYGEKFVVVQMPDELVLRPVPKDPVRDLEEIGRALKGRSVEELKELIDEQARREVGL